MTQRTRSANLGGTVITSTGVVLASGLDVSNQSNAAYQQANTARNTANSAFNHANNAFNHANSAFAHANTIFDQANAAYLQANTARSDANTTFATVNTTFSTVNSAFGTVNTAVTNAHNQANAAYAAANTRVSTSGGSISGDLAITGNLTIQGNATTINVSNLSVNDSLILLSTNAVGDSNDIGFIGHFDRGATATHAGLIRKATQNQFYLFDNYEVEPTNNVIDVTGNNFRVGNLRLGIINANSFVTSAGLNVTDQANNAFAAANNRVLRAGDTMTGSLVLGAGRTVGNGGIFLSHTGLNTDVLANGRTTGVSTGWGTFRIHQEAGNPGLIIAGDASQTAPYVRIQNNAESALVVVDSAGNIGVGVASPSEKLHVVGNLLTTSGSVRIYDSGGGEGGEILLYNPGAPSASPGVGLVIDVSSNNNGRIFSVANNSALQIGQLGGTGGIIDLYTAGSIRARIDGSGNVGVGTTTPGVKLDVIGSIRGSQSITIGNGGGTYQAGSLFSDSNWGMLFRAAQSSPAVAHFSWRTSADGELMRMDASGNLGINMTPGRRLDVNGGGRFVQDTAATTGAITLRQNSGDTVSAYIQWVNNAATVERGWMTMDTSSNFILATASAEKLRVTSDGNVGIGTSSPGSLLDVNGTVRVGTSLTFMGTPSTLTKQTNQRLDIGAAGGLDSATPFWIGYHWSPPDVIQNSSGQNSFPRTSFYFNYNQANNPSNMGWNMYVGNTNGVPISFNLGTESAGAINLSTSASTRMTVASGGKVGIGTTSPATVLDISHGGASDFGAILRLHQSSIGNSDGPKLEFRKTMTSSKSWAMGILNGVNVGTFTINEDGSSTGFGTSRFSIAAGGAVTASTDMRAPIFYDSDNTSYYVNPADGGFSLRGGNSNRVTFSTNDSGFRVDNAEGSGGSDLRLGAAWGYNGVYHSGNLYLSSGGSATHFLFPAGVSKGYIDSGGVMQVTGSHRAPVFYDSDDTNAYFDGGAGNLVLRSIAPTIYFRDTDHLSAMLHNNSNLLYVLRGAVDTTSFTQVNGQWPFIFYLGDNNALCGGSFSAVGNVTAYSSDKRLKINIKNIPNALDKVLSLNGVTFDWVDRVKELGFTPDTMINDAGIIAQEVQAVLPQAVKPAPFDREWDNDKNEYVSRSGEDFITVQYEKLVPLLIEAIKELKAEIDTLKQRG